ncbi:MAG: hypothetical protein ABSG25_15170, partial [Bryobacteraceae bacterium]
NLKEVVENVTCFDVNIFNLKTEANIDLSNYNVGNRVLKKNIDEKEIIFLESQYDIKNIMNMVNSNVTLYHIDNKYYCNYSNACKLFRTYIENKKDLEFEILEMKDKTSKV